MKIFKRFMALMLVVGMMIGVMPTSVFAAESGETSAADAGSDEFYRILHLDCGRKYFTKDWIIALINEMAAVGYTHLELAFGNDGLRFLLDDMSVGTYSDDQVTAAIQAANEKYYDAGDKNELTQAEMDAIIAHANSKGIKIIPLLNNPGHMNAIVSAITSLTGKSAGYNDSASTIDLENSAAVSFTKALAQKYMNYFSGKGCTEFNMGADEYANDVYSTGSMGFGALVSAGKYSLFVDYVNDIASLIKDANMKPIAFNDGIYFNKNTNYDFDKDIMVTFWTSGWSGYQSASAETMSKLGHDMINTHGDYYYVLGKSDKWDTKDYTDASNWDNTSFMGSTVSDPKGAMFCIWCDSPGAETETKIAENVRLLLRAMAAEMQGKDANSISTDVVSGGFTENGTIAETREWVTVAVENNAGMTVSGYELTGVTVTEETAPTIEGAANVKAWDITPNVNGAPYTERGTVKLPVPNGWNTARLTGFYVENDKAVLVKGSYADGYYTFDMPHFSVAGIAELADDDVELIELNVGERKTITDPTGNYEGSYTGEGLDTSIANVAVNGYEGTTETTVSSTKATVLEDGATYIVRVYNEKYALSANKGKADWGTQTLAFEWNNLTAETEHLWTLEASGNGYKLKNAKGYLNLGTGNNAAYLNNSGEVFSIKSTNTGWTIGNQYSKYINALGGLSNYTAGGWTADSTRFDLYKVTEATDASTEITFTGNAKGETYVTIGDTVYKIVVHGPVNITINYVDQDSDTVKTETVSVMDNATAYTVSSFNDNGKYYVVEENTLAITPGTVTEYTVKVTEMEEDLSKVDPLTIEYWQTNSYVADAFGSKVYNRQIKASEVYSAVGVDVSSLVTTTPYKHDAGVNDPALKYWCARLLDRDTNLQIYGGDDRSLSGSEFKKIRYWNSTWAVYTSDNVWVEIDDLSEYQFAVYFMNDMNLADEVLVGTSEWGKKGDGTLSGAYLGQNHVSVAFQIVYEDGTTAPSGKSGADLAPYTYLVDDWGTRGIGTFSVDQIGDYQIWKITAETGTHTTNWTGNYNAVKITDFTWDGNEATVWEDEKNHVSRYVVSNPSRSPSTDGVYANLTWNERNESILIRLYVTAVQTEDSLTVVYYDEKFNDTLYSYNISVPAGNNFNNSIVNNKGEIQKPGAFDSDSTRVDVSGYGIENALNKTQYFQTDLTQVPQAVGKYNNGLYTYAGSEIKDDGKTLYLYYTIDQEALSPNFVVDFGLPLTFKLSAIVTKGIDTVKEVRVNSQTRYGTLAYVQDNNGNDGTFTYFPTQILPNIDVLTISILFAGDNDATIVNVGVTPATTVYYEESFLTYGDGWGTIPDKPTTPQRADVLGSSTIYGYDDTYQNSDKGSNNTVATSNTAGASAQFSFTGTGFQLYGNSDADSGFVTVYSAGKLSKLYMIDTKLSAGDTDATKQQSGGTYYSLPIISETDLPHGEYTVYIKQTNGDNPIHIDGVRIINTIDESGVDSGDSVYFGDKEDKPEFYELRDHVLNAIGVESLGQSDYIADPNNDRDSRVKAITDMAGQVYHALGEGEEAVIIDNNTTSFTQDQAQDLLDNGPKNELYLYPNQTLAFKVTTDRVMQLGLKAPKGSAQFKLNGTETELKTTVDMFYKVAEKATDSTKGRTVTVTVENTGDKVLSVTNLKICDDPNAAFTPLTQEDMENVLLGVYGLSPVTYADAALTVDLVDYAGRKLGSFDLTANGVEGETAVFTAGEIAAAAQAALPGKYALADESAITDVEVVYGESQESRVRIGKVATLNITFVDRRGRKLDSAAITAVQTSGGRCRIPASEIKSLAPKGTRTSWYAPVTMQFGRTNHIVVPVK